MIRRTILTVLLLVFCGAAAAQKYPERRAIRSGNRQYEKGAYPEAETAYRRALEKTPDSPEATFNLSDALYKQERYDEAGKLAASAAQQLAACLLYTSFCSSLKTFASGKSFWKRRMFSIFAPRNE